MLASALSLGSTVSKARCPISISPIARNRPRLMRGDAEGQDHASQPSLGHPIKETGQQSRFDRVLRPGFVPFIPTAILAVSNDTLRDCF